MRCTSNTVEPKIFHIQWQSLSEPLHLITSNPKLIEHLNKLQILKSLIWINTDITYDKHGAFSCIDTVQQFLEYIGVNAPEELKNIPLI